MLRGSIVVITSLFSIIFLKRKLYLHHWTSLLLILCGVGAVGYIGVTFTKDEEGGSETPTTVTGVILILISQCFTGAQFIIQEKLLSAYYVDTLLLIGLEGAWGCFYYAILLPIFQHVECDGALCGKDGKLEDTKAVFQTFADYPTVLICSCCYLLSISAFNTFGINITKFASSAQRATIDSCRTFLIWIVSLSIGWEVFYWQQLIAFLVLLTGTLIYNEIVIVPWEPMNRNTRANREKQNRTSMIGSMVDRKQNPDYIDPFSGSFTIDAMRNTRNLESKIMER